jgi:hypothetical protein
MRGRAVAARRAHNPEVSGSNPLPATRKWREKRHFLFNLHEYRIQTTDPGVMSVTLKVGTEIRDILNLCGGLVLQTNGINVLFASMNMLLVTNNDEYPYRYFGRSLA